MPDTLLVPKAAEEQAAAVRAEEETRAKRAEIEQRRQARSADVAKRTQQFGETDQVTAAHPVDARNAGFASSLVVSSIYLDQAQPFTGHQSDAVSCNGKPHALHVRLPVVHTAHCV